MTSRASFDLWSPLLTLFPIDMDLVDGRDPEFIGHLTIVHLEFLSVQFAREAIGADVFRGQLRRGLCRGGGRLRSTGHDDSGEGKEKNDEAPHEMNHTHLRTPRQDQS